MDDRDDDATDRLDEFYVMLGSCMDAARLARLAVELELDDGTVTRDVPVESALAAPDEPELDHSGARTRLTFGGTSIELARVRRYAIERPPVTTTAGPTAVPSDDD